MLIDVLVYIALLALILGLAFAAFYRTLEHSRQLERNVADVLHALRTGERWRKDMRSATQPPSLARSAEALTLRIPHAHGHVAYVFRDGAVFREEAPGGQQLEVLPNVKASDFHRDAHRHVTAWRWELELRGKQTATRVQPLFTFQAVAPTEVQP
jgi:hypothetical protein